MEDLLIDDIGLGKELGRVTIAGWDDHSRTCAQLFESLAAEGILVSAIAHNGTSANAAELTFCVPPDQLQRAAGRAGAVAATLDPPAEVVSIGNVAVIRMTGVGMRSHANVAAVHTPPTDADRHPR